MGSEWFTHRWENTMITDSVKESDNTKASKSEGISSSSRLGVHSSCWYSLGLKPIMTLPGTLDSVGIPSESWLLPCLSLQDFRCTFMSLYLCRFFQFYVLLTNFWDFKEPSDRVNRLLHSSYSFICICIRVCSLNFLLESFFQRLNLNTW